MGFDCFRNSIFGVCAFSIPLLCKSILSTLFLVVFSSFERLCPRPSEGEFELHHISPASSRRRKLPFERLRYHPGESYFLVVEAEFLANYIGHCAGTNTITLLPHSRQSSELRIFSDI